MIPYKHQLKTVKFIIDHPRCYIFNDPGTGKTACCLWSIDVLKKAQKINGKILILAPLSIVQNVWVKHFADMYPQLRVLATTGGTREAKIRAWNQVDYDVLIVNHDAIKLLATTLSNSRFNMVIVDESTALKNTRTQRWRALKQLIKRNISVFGYNFRLILMTGTPTPQSPMDSHGQLALLAENFLSFVKTRDYLMLADNYKMYTWNPRPDVVARLNKIMQPAIRIKKQDCLDLPPVTTITLDVDMSPFQKEIYQTVYKHSVARLTSGEVITAVNEGVMVNKLLQICGGFVYDEDKGVVNCEAIPRLDLLVELINESDHGTLIFCSFVHTVIAIMEHLKASGIEQIASIYGATKAEDRNRLIDQFQSGQIKCLVLHPATMAHGVTLTQADTVIWYNATSNCGQYEQAIGRIDRIGQTNKMRAIRLQSTGFEKEIWTRLDGRKSLQGAILASYENNLLQKT